MNVKFWIRLIARKVWAILSEVHTHVLVQVVSYDKNENTCSVRPCVNRIRTMDPNNETTIKFGLLEDVPVIQRGSGKLLLSCAPQEGSYGLLHVAERSTDVWLTKGGIDDPDSVRKFDINDGFFEPGAYPLIVDGDNGKIVVPIETDRISLRTRSGDTEISVLDDESIHIANANGYITMSVAGQADINGNFTVDP